MCSNQLLRVLRQPLDSPNSLLPSAHLHQSPDLLLDRTSPQSHAWPSRLAKAAFGQNRDDPATRLQPLAPAMACIKVLLAFESLSTPQLATEYFSLSPYFDELSNNARLQMQMMFSRGGMDGLDEADLECMRAVDGFYVSRADIDECNVGALDESPHQREERRRDGSRRT